MRFLSIETDAIKTTPTIFIDFFKPKIETINLQGSKYLDFLRKTNFKINPSSAAVILDINQEHPSAVGVKQQHTNIVTPYDEASKKTIEADGVFHVTKLPPKNTLLKIRTADCLAISFVACIEDFTFSAIIHAGWKGFLTGIHQNALEILVREANQKGFSSQLLMESLYIFISPAVFGHTYPCGDDVKNAIRQHKESRMMKLEEFRKVKQIWEASADVSKSFAHHSKDLWESEKCYPDLQLMACCELIALGAKPKHLTIFRENTFNHSCIPSYRTFQKHFPKENFKGSLVTHLALNQP